MSSTESSTPVTWVQQTVLACAKGHQIATTLYSPDMGAGTAQSPHPTAKLKMNDETYTLTISAFNLGVALFCANQLFLRQRHQRVYILLALFFAVQSLAEIITIIEYTRPDDDSRRQLLRWFSLAYPVMLAQPLLFWLYVRALTSEDEPSRITHKIWHALPLVLSICLVASIFMLPESIFMDRDIEFSTLGPMVKFTLIYWQVVEIVFYIQVAAYLYLTMRMLSAYSTRLKDLFATTQDRELSWIWWITTVVAAYLLLSLGKIAAAAAGIDVLGLFSSATLVMDSLTNLAITWVIAIWGVRQQPGLVRETTNSETSFERSDATQSKYERSALTDEHASRIAGKIDKAMTKDLLYRDPNLSLWDLAKHISVTSNYVSQTLNMTLHSSFFDYVNKWRIQDAVTQLQDTDETILVIAYDVGFNSRSSFYNAFKKEMGMTPSALRSKSS